MWWRMERNRRREINADPEMGRDEAECMYSDRLSVYTNTQRGILAAWLVVRSFSYEIQWERSAPVVGAVVYTENCGQRWKWQQYSKSRFLWSVCVYNGMQPTCYGEREIFRAVWKLSKIKVEGQSSNWGGCVS